MKIGALSRLLLILVVAASLGGKIMRGQDAAGAITPAPYQTAWQDLEFGVIVHFSTNTFLNREWGDGTAAPAVFKSPQVNPDQGMGGVRESGAKDVFVGYKDPEGCSLWRQ